jgi:hypothetical protein
MMKNSDVHIFNVQRFAKLALFSFIFFVSSNLLQSREFYPVVYDGDVAYIDTSGNLVINQELETPYEKVDLEIFGKKYKSYVFPDWAYFSEGKVSFMKTWGFWFIRIGKEYGVLDSTGKVLIEPQDDIIWSFNNGKAKTVVLLKSFDYTFAELYTFIDLSCLENKKILHKDFPAFDYCGNFSEGFAVVLVGDTLQMGRTGKYNYTNLNGNLISKSGYDDVQTFSEGKGVVMVDSLWGIVDSTGEFLVKPKFHKLWSFSNGLARFFDGKSYGFINAKGEMQFGQMFALAADFSDGFAKVQIQENEYTYINTNGQFLTPNFISQRQLSRGKGFAAAGNFSNNLAPVMIDGLWGYLNTKGELAIPAIYNFAQDFRDGFAQVWKDNKMFILNTNGKVIWTYDF